MHSCTIDRTIQIENQQKEEQNSKDQQNKPSKSPTYLSRYVLFYTDQQQKQKEEQWERNAYLGCFRIKLMVKNSTKKQVYQISFLQLIQFKVHDFNALLV